MHAAFCAASFIVSRLLTLCNLLLPAGNRWGPPPDRGAQPRHLDAPGLYPRNGGQHWCQLCRHLQGQRPLPVSGFLPLLLAVLVTNLSHKPQSVNYKSWPTALVNHCDPPFFFLHKQIDQLVHPHGGSPIICCTNPVQSAGMTHHDCPLLPVQTE